MKSPNAQFASHCTERAGAGIDGFGREGAR